MVLRASSIGNRLPRLPQRESPRKLCPERGDEGAYTVLLARSTRGANLPLATEVTVKRVIVFREVWVEVCLTQSPWFGNCVVHAE